MKRITRRDFAKAVAGLGLASAVPGIVGKNLVMEDPSEVRQVRPMMGSVVTVSAFTSDVEKGALGVERALDEMERPVDVFNRHDPSSELSRLNREGVLEDASGELLDLLRKVEEVHSATGGAFDPSVLPVLESYEDGGRLDPGDLDRVGFDFEVEGSRVSIPEDAELTLDGVAKGYVVDRGVEVLREYAGSGAVEAGGDLGTFGSRKWTVGIEDPRGDTYLDEVGLSDGAVATSGGYRARFGDDVHHILNPVTGDSPMDDSSVSVRGEEAWLADALSTSLFVMEDGAGIEVVESFGGEALVLPREGGITSTDGWDEA